MKYKEWMNEWLENYVRTTAKRRTYLRYKEIAEQHVAKELGAYELEELTPIRLQRFATKLLRCGNLRTGKGLSASSVNGVITVLQSSLKTACLAGQVPEYVGDRIKRPKAREKQISCFTFSEQQKIEQAILRLDKPKLYGVILCLYTGLRIGELLALEWRDVDLAKGVLTVSKTCYDGKDETGKYARLVDSPKTAASAREIPLPRQILPLLRALKKSGSCCVVPGERGKAVSVRSYQRTFELLLNKLNIPHRGFHSLRHTFATRALECGMDVKTLSEILGHKNSAITLNRYAHSMPRHKKEMMDRLGKFCAPK